MAFDSKRSDVFVKMPKNEALWKVLRCPLDLKLLTDPVKTSCCSQTYSRSNLKASLEFDGECPKCGKLNPSYEPDTFMVNVLLLRKPE